MSSGSLVITTAPRRYASCRDGQRRPLSPRLGDEDGDTAVSAIERDERAGVEDCTAHTEVLCSSCRAVRLSSSVGAPPVASNMLASMVSKSSSAVSWLSTACSTYAETLCVRPDATAASTRDSASALILTAISVLGDVMPISLPAEHPTCYDSIGVCAAPGFADASLVDADIREQAGQDESVVPVAPVCA